MTEKQTTVEDLIQNPFGEQVSVTPLSEVSHDFPATQTEASPKKLMDTLDEKHQEQARALAKQIDEKNLQAIISYGAAAQKQLGEFSHQMLSHVQAKDTGEIGDILNDLMERLNETDPNDLVAENQGFFQKFFGKIKKSIYEMQAKYQEVGSQVDKIAIRLDHEKNGLLNDNLSLEQLYQRNKDFFDALNIYIAAGEIKLAELQETLIPEALEKARVTGDQMDVQVVNDLEQFLDRLEKRNHDLKLTRQMTIQQAPQIRLIQNTNQALAEKIQSSITTTIPLWKNQIAIAMTLLRQKDAVTAQRQVSETTNQLIQKNSEMLKISTIETARENERGIIDLETLQKTQKDLIETLEETLKIQQEGRARRRKAEVELTNMEEDLRQKLLVLSHKEKQIHQD
ncbi:toxic anion resistance protein [Granulicatella elegans]|uniref:toxic anion resistance protein n=1 Tax=Granulicatella elegans TaxID=137732 RepID=UPI000A5031F5|nr:toxic anion resistance protein [Granulicatella elegans]UEA30897.1 toxic anion resistance protein [Granulicatella elegans]